MQREGERWLLFGMRDMFGDKAAAYATYKWVIVRHAVNRSMGQQKRKPVASER